MFSSPFDIYDHLPPPADAAAIKVGFARWRHGAGATFADLLGRLNHDLKPGSERTELMAEMHRLKRRESG